MELSISRRTLVSKSLMVTTGLAIFAMQFGAGNIVFVLSTGQYAQDKNLFAMMGLLISGVAVPLLGLIAIALFDGDYRSFFARIGQVPGFLLTALMLSLLGPFGAIPRCIVLSYSTSKMYLPGISLPVFSLICCLVIFFFAFTRTRILNLIGYFLTPFKIGSLLVLIIFGLLYASSLPTSSHNEWTSFSEGFLNGYQTMDLVGAFFVCAVVLDCLRKNMTHSQANDKSLTQTAIQASCVSSLLLAFIYLGFSYVAAFHSDHLSNVQPQELISKIAMLVLGVNGGIFVCFTVTIACLTTAISLSTAFAEFLRKDVSMEKFSYRTSLLITLGITFIISNLDFAGIIKMLTPPLQICYPALIVLCVVNTLYKLGKCDSVKLPVFLTLGASILNYFLS